MHSRYKLVVITLLFWSKIIIKGFWGLFFYSTLIKYEYPEQSLNQPVPKFDKT
jgi:hypothetical protein